MSIMNLPIVMTKEKFEHQQLMKKNSNCIRLIKEFNHSFLSDKPYIQTKRAYIGEYSVCDIKCAVDHIEKEGWKVDYEQHAHIFFK